MKMTGQEATEYLWGLLKNLTDEDRDLISLIRPVSIGELK